MLEQQKCHGKEDRKLSSDCRRDSGPAMKPRNSTAGSQFTIDDSSRRTSMVFTIDEKDLYGQWNYEPPMSSIKEQDLTSIGSKPQEWRSGYLLKFFYVLGALGAVIVTYLLYRACFYLPPSLDGEE